jgi:hypothetical protein
MFRNKCNEYTTCSSTHGTRTMDKARHEPARAGLGASLSLARFKLARLGLARLSHEPEKVARLELASGSV